jgi:hypothetical protein
MYTRTAPYTNTRVPRRIRYPTGTRTAARRLRISGLEKRNKVEGYVTMVRPIYIYTMYYARTNQHQLLPSNFISSGIYIYTSMYIYIYIYIKQARVYEERGDGGA